MIGRRTLAKPVPVVTGATRPIALTGAGPVSPQAARSLIPAGGIALGRAITRNLIDSTRDAEGLIAASTNPPRRYRGGGQQSPQLFSRLRAPGGPNQPENVGPTASTIRIANPRGSRRGRPPGA